MTDKLILKPGREKSLQRRHPWVFSGAVARVEGSPAPGNTLEVLSSNGDFLARAAYSPASQIRARVWTFDPLEKIDADFFRQRLYSCLLARSTLLSDPATDSYRLVHAESDGLPGLIVDRYADTLSVQFLSAGTEFWRETLVGLLAELSGLDQIYERSDVDVRELEGLPPRVGPLLGSPAEKQIITENGLKFNVDLAAGHKTGSYLDQRVNRAIVRELAESKDVLDCFCYAGGFTANALAGGARSVLAVDSSAEALRLCQQNIE